MKQSQLMHGETLEYWKENAEEDYIKVPISVLKYITILEEQSNQRVIEELEEAEVEIDYKLEYWKIREAVAKMLVDNRNAITPLKPHELLSKWGKIREIVTVIRFQS
tara:strand:+ start:842 stop:1162 length:321 start_codon:yes stop_codon:yes gene_type:complete